MNLARHVGVGQLQGHPPWALRTTLVLGGPRWSVIAGVVPDDVIAFRMPSPPYRSLHLRVRADMAEALLAIAAYDSGRTERRVHASELHRASLLRYIAQRAYNDEALCSLVARHMPRFSGLGSNGRQHADVTMEDHGLIRVAVGPPIEAHGNPAVTS
jgi:hypothetical protein